MESATILKLLGEVRIFAEFGPGDLQDFLVQTVGVSYEAGDKILAEGESGRQMYIILSGKVAVMRKSGKRPVHLMNLGPGESFGEMSLVLPANIGRTASIHALERTAALRLDYDNLARIPDTAAKLYRNLARTLATRLKISTDLVVFQMQHGAEIPAAATIGKVPRKKNDY